jgi:glutamate formiminotransferase
MNLTDYTKSAIYRVFETIKMEAERYGVNVVGSEIVGLVPLQALVDTADHYLRLENFNFDQVLETRL